MKKNTAHNPHPTRPHERESEAARWAAAGLPVWSVLPPEIIEARGHLRDANRLAWYATLNLFRRTGEIDGGLLARSLRDADWSDMPTPAFESMVAVAQRAGRHAASLCRQIEGKRCTRCGGRLYVAPGAGPHFAAARCAACGRHDGWLSKSSVRWPSEVTR